MRKKSRGGESSSTFIVLGLVIALVIDIVVVLLSDCGFSKQMNQKPIVCWLASTQEKRDIYVRESERLFLQGGGRGGGNKLPF